MIEIAKGLIASSKVSGISLFMLSFTKRLVPDSALVMKKEDFSDDEVPGDGIRGRDRPQAPHEVEEHVRVQLGPAGPDRRGRVRLRPEMAGVRAREV